MNMDKILEAKNLLLNRTCVNCLKQINCKKIQQTCNKWTSIPDDVDINRLKEIVKSLEKYDDYVLKSDNLLHNNRTRVNENSVE